MVLVDVEKNALILLKQNLQCARANNLLKHDFATVASAQYGKQYLVVYLILHNFSS